jgi:hypothetical protein
MKYPLKVLAAAVLGSVCSYSMASVNIGGLNLPSGANFDVASVYENVVTGVGQTLRGYGEISQINGAPISSYCAGCELTYRFGGYVVTSLSPTTITFSGGYINLYLGFGADNDFNPFLSANSATDLAAATNGALFLTLKGHTIDALGNTFAGSGNNIGGAGAAGNGAGLADVDYTGLSFGNLAGPGALANANFDTNAIASLFGGNADVQLGSSFSNVFLPHAGECKGVAPTGLSCLAGSADMRGVVVSVPEPETNALMLAGLGVLGFLARRRRAR